tara:strand:- start:1696 stop:1851 length:156 start_codon:yes stop_codon:yes gene_type:complete
LAREEGPEGGWKARRLEGTFSLRSPKLNLHLHSTHITRGARQEGAKKGAIE